MLRWTHRDIAEVLGCSVRQVAAIVASPNGVVTLVKRLADKGVALTCERGKKQVHFYEEVK